jgi:hypothetical protein
MLLLIRVDVRLKADEFPDLCTRSSHSREEHNWGDHSNERTFPSDLFFLKMQLYLLHAGNSLLPGLIIN